jgi:hypothetical protein
MKLLAAALKTWLTWRRTIPLTISSSCVKATGTPKGRGVFAPRAFSDGEVIEECPVVALLTPYEALPDDIKKLVFHWDHREGLPATHALAFGYGSMYNHNNPANMRYEPDRLALILRFIAVRNINVGEELTVNYNAYDGAAVSDNNWWFIEKKIEPITG